MPSDKYLYESQVPAEERESTTFTQDFMIAERFGLAANRDTYRRAFSGWKNHYKYLTELAMTLNHRLFHWYATGGENDPRAALYNELWQKADAWALKHLKGAELAFFLRVLD